MRKRGFTLIELLITLSIMSILLGIGMVRFNVIDKIKANMEIQTMINDVNQAKMKAMAQGVAYNLVLREDSYYIKNSSITADGVTTYRELEYIRFSFDYGINKEIIKYSPNGGVYNAGTIYFKNLAGDYEDNFYKLVVTVAGGSNRVEKSKKGIYLNGGDSGAWDPISNSYTAYASP